jgi:hypothetical protein
MQPKVLIISIILSCSGNLHDNMIIFKQESGYADVNDNSFLKVSLCLLYDTISTIMRTLHMNSYL